MRRVKKFMALFLMGALLVSSSMMASATEISDLFNATVYAQANPDIVAAIGSDEAALYNHFITSGMAEGRVASVMFDVQQYKKQNPDLVKLYGDNNAAYYQHYLTNGIQEKRNSGGLMDPIAYADAYKDIKDAYGYNIKALENHFIQFGLAEGRLEGLQFNATCYAALNPDLAKQYGGDKKALFEQYLTQGLAQGRKGARTDRTYKWYCDQKGDHTIENWVVETKTTCIDPGIQRGTCAICGEKKTNVVKADGRSHFDKNQDDRCDYCNARLNTYLNK